jgi:hypothetical protein
VVDRAEHSVVFLDQIEIRPRRAGLAGVNEGKVTMSITTMSLPPSLAVSPNIPWYDQTLDQLREERAYWDQRVRDASGPASAAAAAGFRDGCDRWIERREGEDLSRIGPSGVKSE